jgi:hypothetical protein
MGFFDLAHDRCDLDEDEYERLFGLNPMTTMAAIDWRAHHVTIPEFTGDSHRAQSAKANGKS